MWRWGGRWEGLGFTGEEGLGYIKDGAPEAAEGLHLSMAKAVRENEGVLHV